MAMDVTYFIKKMLGQLTAIIFLVYVIGICFVVRIA